MPQLTEGMGRKQLAAMFAKLKDAGGAFLARTPAARNALKAVASKAASTKVVPQPKQSRASVLAGRLQALHQGIGSKLGSQQRARAQDRFTRFGTEGEIKAMGSAAGRAGLVNAFGGNNPQRRERVAQHVDRLGKALNVRGKAMALAMTRGGGALKGAAAGRTTTERMPTFDARPHHVAGVEYKHPKDPWGDVSYVLKPRHEDDDQGPMDVHYRSKGARRHSFLSSFETPEEGEAHIRSGLGLDKSAVATKARKLRQTRGGVPVAFASSSWRATKSKASAKHQLAVSKRTMANVDNPLAYSNRNRGFLGSLGS